MKASRLSAEPFLTLRAWPCIVACVLTVMLAVVPDERLARLKLLTLELGLLFMITTTIALLLLRQGSPRWRTWPQLTIAPVLFVAVQAWLWWLAPEKSLANVELRRVITTATSFWVFATVGFSSNWQRRFLWSWAAAACLVALYGILQKNGGLGDVLVPYYDRPIGTFGNPIFFAAYLLLSLFVTFQCFRDASGSFGRSVALVISVCILTALALTRTRAAGIGLFAALLCGILLVETDQKRRWMWGVGLLTGAAIAFVTMHTTVFRDQAHLLIWRDTLAMWKTHPFFGVGVGSFHVHFPDFMGTDLSARWPTGKFVINDAHNEYLQELAEGGLVGAASWQLVPLLFIVAITTRVELRRSDPWLIAGVLALAVQNFFSVDMRFGISASLAAQMMGLIIGAERSPWPSTPRIAPRRWLLVGGWVAAVGLVVPVLLRPYRAWQDSKNKPDFFDQRLLTPNQTIHDLEGLAQQYPSEPSVVEKLGFAYAKQIRTTDKRLDLNMARHAIAAYEQVCHLDPQRASAYNNLANIHYTIGDTDAAIKLWHVALEKNPHFVDAHLNLGKVFYTQGKLKQSAAELDAVLQDDPSNNEATVYLKKMVE